MNISVDNVDVNGYYFYMNSATLSIISNHNSDDYTKKRDEISTKKIFKGK